MSRPAEADQEPSTLAEERGYVAGLYQRLDQLRIDVRERLRTTRLSRAGGVPQARSERDAFAARDERRLAQLMAVDDSLCFGRLDTTADQRHYIGRIGLSGDEQATLLVDWRAPAAEPFYRATAAKPEGLVRRRHLRTRQREVLGVDDEVFDLDALTDADRHSLSGEAALMAALQEHRTGRMRDVVATLQAEQDEVVRSPREGVLVVQGGPGTGKTVVALHRAAYLLYTYRDRLASGGVLVVGPGRVFLRYVDQVLPSLGETAVVLASQGELFPGVVADAEEPEAVAAVKGDRRMVAFIAAAVADREQLLDRDVTLRHESHRLVLDRKTVQVGRDRARKSGRGHNPARNIFVRHCLTALAVQQFGRQIWTGMDRFDRDAALRDLIRNPAVRSVLTGLWPHLSATTVLEELLATRSRLAAAGRSLLNDAELLLLHRPPGRWTPADVPLLDEAAELIGETDPFAVRAEARARADEAREQRYAGQVLGTFGGGGMISSEQLAERYAGADPGVDVAERALSDRTWAFAHLVVDEAQEVSWMGWRLLVRRCPTRSMTVVGDVAQAGAPWAARSWAQVLDDHAPGRWRSVELTVGYRTPEQVMAVAADILATVAPELTAPRAVRVGEHPPVALRVVGDPLQAVADQVRRLTAADVGRIAVLTSAVAHPGLLAELAACLPERVGTGTDAAVAVLTVKQSKGLEFDAVVLLDPAGIEAETRHGGNDLYVAVTRTTDRLVVLHPGPLPAVLQRLQS